MEFKVNTDGTRSGAAAIAGTSRGIASARSSVSSVRSGLAISGQSRATVISALKAIEEKLQKEEGAVKTMGTSLQEIVSLYENAEKTVVGQVGKVGSSSAAGGGQGAGGGAVPGGGTHTSWSDIIKPGDIPTPIVKPDDSPSKGETAQKWKGFWSSFWKLISSAGGAGNLISAVGSWVTGDHSAGNIITTGKYLNKLVGNIAKAVEKGSTETPWWKYFTGLDRGTRKPFLQAWGEQFGKKLNFGQAKGVAGKVQVATAWAGHALTFATNAYDSYKEMQKGKITAGQATARTIGGTAVDIALASAATAALTAAGAPAIVIAGGTVLVSWAANGVCEKLTGKDLGDLVSDGLYNVGKGAVQVGKNIKKGVERGVKSAVESGKKAVKFVGDMSKNLFGNVSTRWSKGIFSFA